MPYIEETSIIETSYSLDASRNGVMNKETLKIHFLLSVDGVQHIVYLHRRYL